VLHNETTPSGHWLAVRLRGSGRNTDALGALVTVRAPGTTVTVRGATDSVTVRAGGAVQVRVVRSGTSYLSQDDLRQHFGLGAAAEAESVEVRWPDGTTTRRENVKADQTLLIEQGR
jgi:hypothetical protein